MLQIFRDKNENVDGVILFRYTRKKIYNPDFIEQKSYF